MLKLYNILKFKGILRQSNKVRVTIPSQCKYSFWDNGFWQYTLQNILFIIMGNYKNEFAKILTGLCLIINFNFKYAMDNIKYKE